jgi:hypothetical protein
VIRELLFQLAAGIILFAHSNASIKAEKETIVQFERKTDQHPVKGDKQQKDYPTEKEDSKEKETEDSNPKNSHSNLSLVNQKSITGKALWSTINIRFALNKYIQEINQPPEFCFSA